MTIFSRLRNGLPRIFSSSSIDEATEAIEIVYDKNTSPEDIMKQLDDMTVRRKAKTARSKLDVRRTDHDLAYATLYSGIRALSSSADMAPRYGDPLRDEYLYNIWKEEPILAGAVYSMTAKMAALRWSITGKRLSARNAATILASAAHFDGYGWGSFISSSALDFYTVNRGVFWETPRIGNPMFGKMSDLGHIDALACTLTGNKQYPMVYASDTTGQILRFRPGEYIHFVSLPSSREQDLGSGHCAVERSLRAAKLLIKVHDYDDEKLNNLPPEGVAAVSGMTMDEFTDALKLWQAARQSDKSYTFPQVLWLIGSQPNVTVRVDITGFSQLPESFDRQEVVTHYVSTLALVFGVDAREFWPISSGSLGTAAESEIQHLKAKGKGPGEFISFVERHINGNLDDETEFKFDTQDIEEDHIAATITKAWIDAYYPLYTGTPAGKSKASPAGKPNTEMVPDKAEIPQSDAMGQSMGAGAGGGAQAEQVITKEQLLRLLADKGVIPEWMLDDARTVMYDTSVHVSKELHDDDYTTFVFENNILKESRLPPIILESKHDTEAQNIDQLTGAEEIVLDELIQRRKELEEQARNIHGKPIPEGEVARGTRVTRNTLRDELQKWRNSPILAPYAPTDEELEAMISTQKI